MVSEMVDWNTAHKFVNKFASSVPALGEKEIVDLVATLQNKAEEALPHVFEITGLRFFNKPSQVLVVDRVAWSEANIVGFEALANPVFEKLRNSSGYAEKFSGFLGLQAGIILSFLSNKVLGQYENFSFLNNLQENHNNGRLLLVAPNIFVTAKKLDIDLEHFMLWVCLHEQTHQWQFAVAPWLFEHLVTKIQDFLEIIYLDKKRFFGKNKNSANSQKQKQLFQEITAIMTLLEGHANVVMDAVDSSIIPSVQNIRQKFSTRKSKNVVSKKFFEHFLDLESKMKQYKEGARFVNDVVKKVGMPGLNQIFVSETFLPTEKEITNPTLWVKRVHG